MIAGDTYMLVSSQELNTIMGFRPIANDVPQAPYFVDTALMLDIAQYRGKGSQVGMYIGDNGVTHMEII